MNNLKSFYKNSYNFCSKKWTNRKTLTEGVDSDTIVSHYRGIYILNCDFNLGFGTIFTPCLKLGLVFLFVFTFFAMVRLRKDLDILTVVFLTVATFTTASLVFPTSIIMSSLYDVSSQFQPNMLPFIGMIPEKKDMLIAQGQVRACQLIRCKVGNLYHMEAKAKLTLLNHVVNGIVFLLVNVRK